MGRKPKIPLKDILLVPEISSRDNSLAGTKAASAVQAKARTKQLEAMIHGIRLWDGPEAEFSRTFASLVVAEPPADLPRKYKTKLREGSLILVDGMQRYQALLETKGEDFQATVERVAAPTMLDLRALAFERNFQSPSRYFVPLTQEEIWANYLRMALGGRHSGNTRKEIAQAFGGWIKEDYLKTWGQLTKQARDLLSLEDKSEAQIQAELRDLLKNTIGRVLPGDLDQAGYPDKLALKQALSIAENGYEAAFAGEMKKLEQREKGRQQYEAARKQKALEALAELGFDTPEKIQALIPTEPTFSEFFEEE